MWCWCIFFDVVWLDGIGNWVVVVRGGFGIWLLLGIVDEGDLGKVIRVGLRCEVGSGEVRWEWYVDCMWLRDFLRFDNVDVVEEVLINSY